MKNIAGIDVHKDMLVLAYRKDGKIVEEILQYDVDGLNRLLETLASNGITRVIIESTGDYYYPLYYFLSKSGVAVDVMNAYKVKRPEPNKTDRIDAVWLLKVGESGLFSPSYIPSEELLALRKLVRTRFKMADIIADQKRRINSLLWQLGVKLNVSSILKSRKKRGKLKTLLEGKKVKNLDKHVVSAVREILRRREVRSVIAIILSSIGVIEALEKAIDRIDSEIKAIAVKYRDEIGVLMSVPGVSFTLAAAILSEIGDISRFPSPSHLASYAGLAPTVKESGGKVRLVKTSRKSNKYLSRYMFIAAMAAMRSKSPKIRSFADRLLKRGKHYKAVVIAVARKMLTIMWYLLNRRTTWREENYEKKAKVSLSGKAKSIPIEDAIKILEMAEKKGKIMAKKDYKSDELIGGTFNPSKRRK